MSEETSLFDQIGYKVWGDESQRDKYPLCLLPRRSGEEAHDFWRFALDGQEIISGRLAWLAGFLPVFERPEMTALKNPSQTNPDRMALWHAATAAISFDIWNRFHVGAYETGWVDLDAPWSFWKTSREGRAFKKNFIARAAKATPLQMHKVITAICRTERFCEGEIEGCFTNGWMEALCRRASVLLADCDA